MSVSNLEARIRRFGRWRVFDMAWAALCAVMAWGNLAYGSPIVAAANIFSCIIMVCAAMLMTKAIRRSAAALRRPDYAAIARMEREVWGVATGDAPAGRQSSEPMTWCIACQQRVPYSAWNLHVEHSQEALHAYRDGEG